MHYIITSLNCYVHFFRSSMVGETTSTLVGWHFWMSPSMKNCSSPKTRMHSKVQRILIWVSSIDLVRPHPNKWFIVVLSQYTTQTQNQFRQVVKYSTPFSQDSFEDEIDGLFFSVGYGRIFSWRAGFFGHGRFVDMFHVDKWSVLKLPFAHVVVPWCRMLQPACRLPWKETREELLRKFCTWSYGHGWMPMSCTSERKRHD